MIVRRLGDGPIIRPHMDSRMGDNINGPSLIRAPDWLKEPLGQYYLYFADHRGTYIRLAYADRLEGPWSTHAPGTLRIEQTRFVHHIASPDVHIDEERRQIRMYCHGRVEGEGQRSIVAFSSDGLCFEAADELIGRAYMRRFDWRGGHYALCMPGVLYRSKDGITGFERGPQLFTPEMRHAAVALVGDDLYVFYTNAGDCPERILLSRIRLTPDWRDWRASEPEVVLEPETDYEGGSKPLEPSERGPVWGQVRELRDPAIYREDGSTYLLYSVAGENGIAIAELVGFPPM